MAKKDFLGWIMWIVALLVSIAVGGLFVNGTMMNAVILSLLPLIVHQIVGWIIIISAIVGAIMSLTKR